MSQFALQPTCPIELVKLYQDEAPQKDYLCGPFWGALALRSAGIDSVGDEQVDQDFVARAAGTTRQEGDPYASLPPGVSPRVDYRLPPPTAADPATSGTSSAALRQAIVSCARGQLSALPIAGPWNATSLAKLARVVAALGDAPTLIANVRTGQLWGSRTRIDTALDFLRGGDPVGPAPDWDVGHFVALVLAITYDRRTIFGVLDTYPTLGWGGYHLQPDYALAAGLNRGDGHEGGILCVSHADQVPLEKALEAAGFAVRDWDNGSRVLS